MADGFDDDLVGCLRATKVWLNVFLANWDVVLREREILERSPDPRHRGLGLAICAFLSARTAPDQVETLALLGEGQLAEGSGQPRRSNADTVARWMIADARASQAIIVGQSQAVLDHASEFSAAATAVDDRGYSHISVTTAAATAQILLGNPAQALETISWLSELETEINDGTEIRALAHLALGNLDRARVLIRVHATRGMSGRFHGEASDSLVLLAELARAEGDETLARHLLLHVGHARQYATMRVAL